MNCYEPCTSVGWEMNTSQSSVTLCSWGVKAGMDYSIYMHVWVTGKTSVVPC